MANIPIDFTLNEILPRLPVKSLLRFRCVSQQFLYHISHPNFAKLQLKRAYENANRFNINRILLLTNSEIQSLDHETTPFGDWSALQNFELDEIELKGVSVIGSCNGLVCMATYENYPFNIYICNPCLEECRRLSDPPRNLIPYERCKNVCIFGFGYVSSTDDYKVVLLESADYNHCTTVYIYSLRRDSWKRIEYPDSPYGQISQLPACLFNGSLHSPAARRGRDNPEESEVAMLVFDLETETFAEMLTPGYSFMGSGGPFFNNAARGGDVGERLCFSYKTNTDHEIWMMQQYGLNGPWTKMFDIPREVAAEAVDDFYILPVCMTKNGRIVIVNESELIRCDPMEGILEKIVVCYDGYRFHSVVYTESLISPYDFDQDEMEIVY